MRFFRQIQGCAQARTVGARFKIRVTKADVSGIILIYRLLNIYFWNSIYTAGGDRSLKLTGANQQMLINNQYYINFANLNENKSLYMGAYMVLMNSNYTKHYYIEGERVCTKIGGGFGPGPNIPFKGELHPLVGDYETMRHELWKMTMRFRECTQGPDIAINEKLEPCYNGSDEDEKLQYFYHPDHLGSSSFITDAMGYATQHLQYLPYGETFVDQHGVFDSRYTFSAKELDDETQYSYFGARYYDSDLSVWLSVDPLSDKYPSLSSFAYCANNPVMFRDPNGMEIDPSELKNCDNETYSKVINDWQNQTGYTLKENETYGRLEIDKSAGIKRDENGKKIGSNNARRLLRAAINSDKVFTLKPATEDMFSSQANQITGEIFIHKESILELMGNFKGGNSEVIGFGMSAFHELAHMVYGIDDGPNANNANKRFIRRGPAARIINGIENDLYGIERKAYRVRVGENIYVPYDRSTLNSLRKGIVPLSGVYTFITLPISNARGL